MDRSLDAQLNDIKKIVLTMGATVEKSIGVSVEALVSGTIDHFREVHSLEEKIDQAHIHLDHSCLQFLAQQGPVARDLRFIFSLIKMNNDLERMGDQAVNIAHSGKDYLAHPLIPLPPEIQEMGQVVRQMVRECLDCFFREDVELAEKVLLLDDEVDARRNKIIETLTRSMGQNPEGIQAGLHLIQVVRNLERLGDHATNIAEDVIFVSTGKDVRHGGKFS